jgi:hypothetical protein
LPWAKNLQTPSAFEISPDPFNPTNISRRIPFRTSLETPETHLQTFFADDVEVTEPGADRGPQAGSRLGVVVATARENSTREESSLSVFGMFPG